MSATRTVSPFSRAAIPKVGRESEGLAHLASLAPRDSWTAGERGHFGPGAQKLARKVQPVYVFRGGLEPYRNNGACGLKQLTIELRMDACANKPQNARYDPARSTPTTVQKSNIIRRRSVLTFMTPVSHAVSTHGWYGSASRSGLDQSSGGAD